MAFGRSELRLILGVQAYGTSNLARLRRDIMSLNRTADIANANQERVAAQAARQAAKINTLRERINTKEASIAKKFTAADATRDASLARSARARNSLLNRETSLMTQHAAKRVQIAGTEAAIAKGRTGSAALRGQVAQMRLSSEAERFAHRRIGLAEKELGIQSQIRTNRATTSTLERQLTRMGAKDTQVQRWRQAGANLGNMGTKMREVVNRLQAADLRATKLASSLKGMPAEVAMLKAEVATLDVQEQKVLATIDEQVAAMTRLDETLKIQQAQLEGIVARQADIAAELKVIGAEETQINALHADRIAELNAENVALNVRRAKLVEEEAILARLTGEEAERAAIADRQAVAANKLAKREVLGRTIAHAGRTAQFGGLIGTAVLGATANAAAELGRKTALAGTQMRDVAGSFQQAAGRGKELQNVILHMMERFPADAQEMADSAYEIFSSMNLVHKGVVDVTEGYKLMATANKMAVAGQVDLGEATSAMITVLNNFDPSLQHVNQTMNQVFAIVRFGQMRLSDFAAAMVPLAPVARSVGLSLTDVGSALATLTIVMKSPQAAAQGLARAIELLQLEPFKKGLHSVGVEVTDLHTKRMRPLHSILRDLIRQMPEMGTSQKSMVQALTQLSKNSQLTKAGIQGTVQARRALANLLLSMKLYDNILSNVSSDQHEFNDAFNAMKDTPGVQWAIFINQMKAFALTIGQAALPVMLQFGQWLINAAHWIERLIKSTNGAIVRWIAWGAVGALLLGTLTNIAGSFLALAANMRIASGAMMTAEGEAAKASMAMRLLSASMMALMGIGIIAIPIVVQFIRGGDPSIATLVMGALSGAIGGAMIGSAIGTAVGGPGVGTAIGALVGGITVPVILEVIAHYQKDDQKTPAEVMFAQYQKAATANFANIRKVNKQFGIDPNAGMLSIKAFTKQWRAGLNKIPDIGEDVATGKGSPKVAKRARTLFQIYQDYFKRFTAAQIDAQNAWFDQMGGNESKADTAARLAKARAKIISDAWDNMQKKIDQAVDKLGGVYDKFLEQNKSTFGEIGKGPVLSGFMGDIFHGLNDLLMQFGESVAIPPELINRDLEIQMKNFDKITTGYAQLIKKGVPAEIVQQIQAQGMDALPFVQGLLQMSGPAFKRWVAHMKESHDKLIKATDIDFDRQLKIWKKYGSDIATKMIEGLSSDAAKKTLTTGFRKNVIELFGDTFRKEMAKEIADALKDLAAQEAARIKADKAAKAAAAAAKKAREKGGPPLAGKHPGVSDSDARTAAEAGKKAKGYVRGQGIITHSTSPGSSVPIVTGEDVSRGRGGARGPHVIVNNHGDQYTVHADGVHPNSVVRAINKQSFKNRSKRRGR